MEFADIIRAEEFYQKLKKQYRLPSESLISATFELFNDSEGDLYTLLGLAFILGCAGMKRFTVAEDWFDLSEDRARINIVADREFRPKGGHEGFTMGNKAIATSILNKASGDDLLITTRSDYGRVLYDKLIKQLRHWLGQTQSIARASQAIRILYSYYRRNLYVSKVPTAC